MSASTEDHGGGRNIKAPNDPFRRYPSNANVAQDPATCQAENYRQHDELAHMISDVEKRVEGHDTLLGRDGEALQRLVQDAVAQAISQVASDPKLWASIRAAMVTQTKEAAGGWLLNGLSSVGTKLFWAVAICAGLYLVGGWALVVKAAKALSGP